MTRAPDVCARGRRARVDEVRKGGAAQCDQFESLTYQISHELRTPLNAVIGFSDLIRSERFGPVGNPRYREYLDHISESAERMLQAANETLALTSMLAAPQPVAETKPFNLANAVVEAIGLAEDSSDGSLPPTTVDIPSSFEVWGDSATIIAALANLIRAAAAAGAANRITIAADRINYDTVRLSIRAASLASTKHSALRRKPAIRDADLLSALALSLLRMQELQVETMQAPATGFAAEIELELSAQQALAL